MLSPGITQRRETDTVGYKKWTRERLTVADLQNLLQNQVVLHFASAAAADTAIPAGDRVDGMVRWLDDVERAEYYDADATTWRFAFGTPARQLVTAMGGGFYVWKTEKGTAEEPPQLTVIDGRVNFTGMVGNSAAFGVAATMFAAGAIPAAYRPAVLVRRMCRAGNVASAGFDIGTDGGVLVTPGGSLPIDTPFVFDVSWNLVNG